jgi:putative ABC transport system permease protein
MFARLVYESFRRQMRRKLLAAIAIMLGVGVATAMLGIATGIGDKISRELRSYGANILVIPEDDTLDLQIDGVNLKPPSDGAYLSETDLPKIKGMFWRNNIVGFAPMLPVAVKLDDDYSATLVGTYFDKHLVFSKGQFTTGVRKTNSWWKIDGSWPDDESGDVLLGAKLAGELSKHSGDSLLIAGETHRISGIVTTGGAEDNQIIAPLRLAQDILGRPGAVRSLFVSAVTKPEDAFARRDPRSLNAADYDRWYCSPYATSIAFQLQEAIPHSHAEQIRQVAQNEGAVLSRIEGLMMLITFAALFASALAVSAAMAAAIFERRAEIGLMKALGARRAAVAALFFTEATLLAVIGGIAGFVVGIALAHRLGESIFGSQISVEPVLLPVVLVVAVVVTFAGSAVTIRRAVNLDAAVTLRGEA